MATTSSSMSLSVGDLVWGKVKSYPWWPGYIIHEAFALPEAVATKANGHTLVAFFGDNTYSWLEPANVIPFAPNFIEKSRQNGLQTFKTAVDEAVTEVSRRSALGVTCSCCSHVNFRPTRVPGYVEVDVPGYEPGAIYSTEQIKKAQEEFMSYDTLAFVRQLALENADRPTDIHDIKQSATLLAMRKARFEKFDYPYLEAFGVTPTQQPTQDFVSANRGTTRT